MKYGFFQDGIYQLRTEKRMPQKDIAVLCGVKSHML